MRSAVLLLLLSNMILFKCLGQEVVDLNKGTISPGDYFETIPYRYTNGKVIITVVIDERPYNFLLDTGAPFAISEKLRKLLDPAVIGKEIVQDQSGATDSLLFISLPKVNVGTVTFINTPGIVMPAHTAEIFDCLGIDGIIGSNMLRRSIVHIDGQNKKLILTNTVKKLNLNRVPFLNMELTKVQSSPHIIVRLKKGDKAATDKLLFDSGADVFYQMATNAYRWFRKEIDAFDSLGSGMGSYTFGIHGNAGHQEHFMISIPEFYINKEVFKTVIATTTEGDVSRLGSRLLEYGKVTLNYRDKRFYYEPYEGAGLEQLSLPDWGIMPALRSTDGKMVVGIIWDKTLEDQINLGDEILKFGTTDYGDMDLCDIVANSRPDYGERQSLELRDVHTGALKKVTIRRLPADG